MCLRQENSFQAISGLCYLAALFLPSICDGKHSPATRRLQSQSLQREIIQFVWKIKTSFAECVITSVSFLLVLSSKHRRLFWAEDESSAACPMR